MTAGHETPSLTLCRDGKGIRVLCVDDNEQVAEALRLKFERDGGFDWRGWLPTADSLVAAIERDGPAVVLLDLDMPGLDPFVAVEALAQRHPDCRVVVFSGHVRADMIDKAFTVGAWGYVSKNDGEGVLMDAVRAVCRNEIMMSDEVRSVFGR